MDISSWKHVYKINPQYPDRPEETNLIYTPYVSPDNSRFCMHFDHKSKYQNEDLREWLPERPLFTEELVKFFFEREVYGITKFSKYSWSPQNIQIDTIGQRIFFDWNGANCNHIIYGSKNFDEQCPDWKQQLFAILKDIVDADCYKTSLYPHCYFLDNGILRTIDFYGVQEKSNPYVPLNNIKGMMGTSSGDRFDEAITEDMLNVEILFKRAMEKYVKWPDDYLPEVYKRIYE
jgi:hypothetical protein